MDYDSPKAPSMELPCGVNVDSGLVKDAIGDMESFSDKLYFLINSEYFIVNCDGEFGDASFQYLHGEENISEMVKSSFSISKLKDIFTASKFSDIVNIYLGTDMPMIVDFELVTGDGDLKFLLAPRIETDEE
jgi:proliferating cell nuclear antigen